MSESYDLFCRWKYVKKIDSDNAGAIALGISRGTVSLWKQGKNAEIHLIEKMADDIGERKDLWAARVMAERSSSEQERGAWKRIAQQLATTTALALCVMATTLPSTVQAATAGFQAGASSAGMYIMFNYDGLGTWSPCGLAHDCVNLPGRT